MTVVAIVIVTGNSCKDQRRTKKIALILTLVLHIRFINPDFEETLQFLGVSRTLKRCFLNYKGVLLCENNFWKVSAEILASVVTS